MTALLNLCNDHKCCMLAPLRLKWVSILSLITTCLNITYIDTGASVNIIFNPNQKDAVIKRPRTNQMPGSNLYTLSVFALAPGSYKAEQVCLPGSSSQTKHRCAAWPAVPGVRLGFHDRGQGCEHLYASLRNSAHHLHS